MQAQCDCMIQLMKLIECKMPNYASQMWPMLKGPFKSYKNVAWKMHRDIKNSVTEIQFNLNSRLNYSEAAVGSYSCSVKWPLHLGKLRWHPQFNQTCLSLAFTANVKRTHLQLEKQCRILSNIKHKQYSGNERNMYIFISVWLASSKMQNSVHKNMQWVILSYPKITLIYQILIFTCKSFRDRLL